MLYVFRQWIHFSLAQKFSVSIVFVQISKACWKINTRVFHALWVEDCHEFLIVEIVGWGEQANSFMKEESLHKWCKKILIIVFTSWYKYKVCYLDFKTWSNLKSLLKQNLGMFLTMFCKDFRQVGLLGHWHKFSNPPLWHWRLRFSPLAAEPRPPISLAKFIWYYF